MKQKERDAQRQSPDSESTATAPETPADESDSEDENDDDVSPAHIQLNSPRWEDLPSIGSAGHAHGLCKRCCFFPKGRCLNGYSCNFCHFDHEKRVRKNKHKNRQNRDSRRSQRNSDESWMGESWVNDDEWQSQVPHNLPVFPVECNVHMQMPGEVAPMMHPSVGPTCLPCMPPTHESSPSRMVSFEYPQDQCGCAAGVPDFSVQRFFSQDSAQSNALSDTLTCQFKTEVLGSSEENFEICIVEKENVELQPDEVWVWLEDMEEEYQFTHEDLTGFFGSYGAVSQVKLLKGGGASVTFASEGVAARVATDLDSVELPALGNVLRVKSAWTA
jgi:hypothetical protein